MPSPNSTQYQFVVLKAEDAPAVLRFERDQLESQNLDPIERELLSWHSPWRQESLDHYLPLGWSFGLWSDSGELRAYFLAQPLLFFRQMTQSLWVEHMGFPAQKPELALSMMDLAYRLSREKHLQKLLLPPSVPLDKMGPEVERLNPQMLKEGFVEIKTSKLEEL